MVVLYYLDIFGTVIFAITGAFKAIRHELDILGVCVLSLITGVGGGIFRDLLLGDTPPAAFRNETYFIACIATGILTALLAPRIAKIWKLVKVLDAVGLGVFTAIGAAKGAAFDLGIVGILLTGALTATGGGMLRDVLVREIPGIISRDFYATASFAGAGVYILSAHIGMSPDLSIFTAFALTTVFRLLAMKTGLSLPKVKRIPGFKGSSKDFEEG